MEHATPATPSGREAMNRDAREELAAPQCAFCAGGSVTFIKPFPAASA